MSDKLINVFSTKYENFKKTHCLLNLPVVDDIIRMKDYIKFI